MNHSLDVFAFILNKKVKIDDSLKQAERRAAAEFTARTNRTLSTLDVPFFNTSHC